MPHVLLVQSYIIALHHMGCIIQGYISTFGCSHAHYVCIFLGTAAMCLSEQLSSVQGDISSDNTQAGRSILYSTWQCTHHTPVPSICGLQSFELCFASWHMMLEMGLAFPCLRPGVSHFLGESDPQHLGTPAGVSRVLIASAASLTGSWPFRWKSEGVAIYQNHELISYFHFKFSIIESSLIYLTLHIYVISTAMKTSGSQYQHAYLFAYLS